MQVLVTGGTGQLGSLVSDQLAAAGHDVRRLSRHGDGPGGVTADLATGEGLDHAMQGVEAVVHSASAARGDIMQVDVAGTRRLVQAVDRARLRHLVYVSIIGVNRNPYRYYRAKFAAEQIVLASGLPVTLLRAAQFHEFVDTMLETVRRGPLLPVPVGWRLQPVAIGEVATALTAMVSDPPTGGVVELAGPQQLTAVGLARTWAAAHAPRVRIVPLPIPGKVSAAYRAGSALPTTGRRGSITYAQHCAGRLPR